LFSSLSGSITIGSYNGGPLTNDIEKSKPDKLTTAAVGRFFADGLFADNPVFMQALGLCPALAVTATARDGLGMGVATLAVLTLSNLLISLLRRIIPKPVRVVAYIVIIAGLTSAVDMLMGAYMPALSRSLGIFVPLIAVNCIILARAETVASKKSVGHATLDGLGMGLGFAGVLFAVASLREIFGAGSFFGLAIPLWSGSFGPIGMLISPPGAFITLGIVIAACRAVLTWHQKRGAAKAAVIAEQEGEVKDDG